MTSVYWQLHPAVTAYEPIFSCHCIALVTAAADAADGALDD